MANWLLSPKNPFPVNSAIAVNVPSDAIADLKGNSLQKPVPLQFTIGTGCSTSLTCFTSPADGESDVNRDATIYFRFTRNFVQGANWGQITLEGRRW